MTDCSMPWPVPIHEKNKGRCEIGGGVIDVDAYGIFRYTEGWVEYRDGGGGHGTSIPIVHPRRACGACVDKKSKGILDQGNLF